MSEKSATARAEIVELLAGLAQMCDWGTVEEYLELIESEAVWEMPPNVDLGLPANRRCGHAEIEAGVRERRGAGLQGPGTNTLHVVSTTTVSVVSATEAEARSAWQYFARAEGALILLSAGRYDDRLVRRGDRWRLAHRRVAFI